MDFVTKYITPDIKLSLYTGKCFKTDMIFEHHMLVWFISGETKVLLAESAHTFGPGEIFLIPRHQLATVINYPKDGQPHKTVVMHLTQERLERFFLRHAALGESLLIRDVYVFGRHPLLESCMASLIPYFELPGILPEEIADLKITEAITILRATDPGIDRVLAHFEEPGKIDLPAFMERNFMFNLPLERFSYLTGRSVATFRRDFKKIFSTTPQKWLTERRLVLAHRQIAEGRRKPVDVYFEAGFENLSHFSFAFKKRFGYTPTELAGK